MCTLSSSILFADENRLNILDAYVECTGEIIKASREQTYKEREYIPKVWEIVSEGGGGCRQGCESRRQTISSISRPTFREI